MAAQLNPLSASVTRILSLSGFPSELKTRDIQAAFGEWENVNGGFKIKWRDDTSLLIVFADAATAKRAYLQTLASPPTVFGSPTSSKSATIKPYDGADAQAVIQAVNARAHGHSGSRGHHSRSSLSAGGGGGSAMNAPGGAPPNRKNTANGALSHSVSGLNGLASIPDGAPLSLPRDPSPTLPNIPAHPTLNALINSSLSPIESGAVMIPPQGSAAIPIVAPANGSGANNSNSNNGNQAVGAAGGVAGVAGVVAASATSESHGTHGTPPRIGDPGRRMVGHALGIRHPGLSSNRAASPITPVTGGGADQAIREVQRAMGGLTVSAE